jgi:hypothetical protein
MSGQLIAPHLGVWGPKAPRTDNPAARPAPMPREIREELEVLRAEAYATAVRRIRSAPDIWRWGVAR